MSTVQRIVKNTAVLLVAQVGLHPYGWISRSKYKLSSRGLLRTTSKIIIASLIMGVFIKYFTHISLLALVPLSVILYFGIFYALRGLDKDDILIFRNLIRKG